MDLKAPLTRQQPALPLRKAAIAGIGGAITIALLGLLSEISNSTLLMVGFGASCVLVFTVPEAPFSQPINVICGHVISALCGILVAELLPVEWWSIGLAVGMSIALMAMLRVTHPPAGGNPIFAMTSGQVLSYVLAPVLVGAVVVVVIGTIYHRATGTRYPNWIALPETPRRS